MGLEGIKATSSSPSVYPSKKNNNEAGFTEEEYRTRATIDFRTWNTGRKVSDVERSTNVPEDKLGYEATTSVDRERLEKFLLQYLRYPPQPQSRY